MRKSLLFFCLLLFIEGGVLFAQSSGSAVALGGRYFATNSHVINDAKHEIAVTGIHGDLTVYYEAKVVAEDKINDVAVIKVVDNRFEGYSSVPFGFQTELEEVGSDIFVMGYPKISTMGTEVKVTTGTISARTGYRGEASRYQMQAPIQPGNSGGPVFDEDGNLIALSVATHLDAQNVNYAVKLNYLKSLIETSNEDIPFGAKNTLSGLKLPEKVNKLRPYVVLVKVDCNELSSSSNGDSNALSNATPKELYDKALELYSQDDVEGAVELLFASIEKEPHAPAYYVLAYIAVNDYDNYEFAREKLRYCIEQEYAVGDSYGLLAKSYYYEDDYESAIKYYDKAIQEEPNNVDYRYRRGLCKYRQKNYDAAISDFKKALVFEDEVEYDYYADVYSYCGNAMYRSDNPEATEYLKKAIELNPTTLTPWSILGHIWSEQEEYSLAEYAYSNAIVIDEHGSKRSKGMLYNERGYVRYFLKNYNKSYEDLLVAKNEGDEEAAELLEDFNVALLSNTSNKYPSRSVDVYSVEHAETNNCKIEKIELKEDRTIVHLVLLGNEDSNNYMIQPTTVLYDEDAETSYFLLATENCAIYPQWSTIGKSERTRRFKLIFEKVPSSVKKLSLYEGKDSDWNFHGIDVR